MRESHGPLVSCETTYEHLDDWVVFDVRHDLMDPDWGPRVYQKGHLPGAFYAHVDRDLSGPVGNGRKGRHPLPLAGVFARFLSTYGVTKDTQIVAYDDRGGAWAARLWWLARHHGHEAVAVLDGGLARWKALDLPLSTQHEKPRAGSFAGQPGSMPTVDAEAVQAAIGKRILVDARAPERYRGETEPIDPKAGHIPSAVNLPFSDNLGPEGLFLSPDELRARYEAAGVTDAGRAIAYCGSGVTAAHDVLAMEVAGLGTAPLYPGSWSQWCHLDGPVETGLATHNP